MVFTEQSSIVKPPIQAVLFDLGGVVLEIDFQRAFAFWANRAGIDAATIDARYSIDEAYRRHERGQIDGARYFAHLRQTLGLDLSDELMLAGWNRIFVAPIDGVAALLEQLAPRVAVHAFSNTNESHVRHMRQQYRSLFAHFRQVHVSSELGHRKPEAPAFLKVAGLMNCPPSQILFFDDLKENVDGARAVGMSAIQVTSTADIARGLAEAGLIVTQ